MNQHCHHCGEAASVVEDETPLCSECFLAAAVMRRRLATPMRAARRMAATARRRPATEERSASVMAAP